MATLSQGFDPSLHAADEVVAEAQADAAVGLSTQEARVRLERDGANQLVARRPIPAWRRLLSHFADPLVYLLLAATVVALTAWWVEGREGVPYDVIVIAVVILANAALGFIQERRSEDAVAALQRMAAPTAAVLRDGRIDRIPALDVVVGDVLVLGAGDAITADARLTESTLSVAEAALTGESAPVDKGVAPLDGPAGLGDRACMVFAGTAVTRGAGRAIVTATGMHTETGRIAQLLGETASDPTPLQREIAQLSRVLGLGVLAIAAVVIGTVFLTEEVTTLAGAVQVLLLGVALAVAAVPEGLPAILSVVLALGVQRMAKRHAIIKDLSSVETLGSASVICSDKTGTLTQNRMTITRVLTVSGETELTGAAGGLPEGARGAEVTAVMTGGALANDALVSGDEDDPTFAGDPTEVAFLTAEWELGLAVDRRARFSQLGSVPFSSERKRMSVVASDADGGFYVAAKGAPGVLLEACTAELAGEQERPLDEAGHARVLAGVARISAMGMRTLAVAFRREPKESAAEAESLERDLVLAGIVGIVDPPRDEARDAVAAAQGAGIRVIMITGDHPLTASAIAVALGIVEADPEVVTGVQLAEMDGDALREAVKTTSVFARVAPEHKLRIVDALQSHGEVVAMTGDGVNDAPALRSADIGVAMGLDGTEVARGASNMILTNDDFATIVLAVNEGRGILDNIKRFLRYMFASNLGEVLAVFLGVVGAAWLGLRDASGAVVAPLLASQILWMNLLTDLGPALAIGAEPYADDLMSRGPRRPSERLIDRRMWGGIALTGAVMAVVTLFAIDLYLPGGLVNGSGDVATARTAAFTVLVLTQLMNAFSARSETQSIVHQLLTNPWLWGAVTLSLALQIAVVNVPVLNDAFSTAPLTIDQWSQCLGLALVVPVVMEARKWLLRARDRRALAR
ncbi:MAG TPA: cation-translocating P-type ATPase [Demequinaceae bacterium]